MGDMRGLKQLDMRSMWEELGHKVCVCGSVCTVLLLCFYVHMVYLCTWSESKSYKG